MADYLPWAKDGDWQALFGGRTNAAWRVDGPRGEAAVLKLYRSGTPNPLFPNDPRAEAAMLQHLGGHDIAPDLIAAFSVDGLDCNLYHALDGTRWADGVEQVAALIQKLHDVPAPAGLRHTANGSEGVLAQAHEILRLADAELGLQDQVSRNVIGPSEQSVLLHCDIVPGNLIDGADGLRLIDWQCPAIGDATEDIAVFLSPAMQLLYRGEQLTDQETSDFLAAFPKTQQDRYHALAPAYHYRMAAYCLWQMSRGRQEYKDALEVEKAALAQAL